MVDLNPLRRLTEELAEEVAYEEVGPRLRLLELLLDNISSLAVIVHANHRILFINEALKKYLKTLNVEVNIGDKWYKAFWNLDEPPKESLLTNSLRKREVVTGVISSPISNRKYQVSCIPLVYNGVSGYIFLLNELKK